MTSAAVTSAAVAASSPAWKVFRWLAIVGAVGYTLKQVWTDAPEWWVVTVLNYGWDGITRLVAWARSS